MKKVFVLASILCVAVVSYAQSSTDALAIANGRTFTAQDLSPNVTKVWYQLPTTMANAKKALLDRQIETVLLETEAAERKISVEKLLDTEVKKKVSDPTNDFVKKVYDANKKQIGDVTFAKAKGKIIEYLRIEPEKKARLTLLTNLRAKHQVSIVRSPSTPSLKPADILATVGPNKITYTDFTKKNGLVLSEYEASVHDQLKGALMQVVDSALYAAEAEKEGIAPSDYIRREFTDKLVTFSNEEQYRVVSALRKRLYKKYRVSFFLKEPNPFVQQISIDDDPSTGDANAPVTVVMFTDLQCNACATVYPVLKKVLGEYGNQIRFVVRDFPLTSLHENAFQAAVAANAARAQNKYFEYKELLYKNQNALDTNSLVTLAGQIGLDQKRFKRDLKSAKFAEEVRKDMKDGERYGVNSTPTVFVNGIKVRNLSEESFHKAINRFIRK